MEAVAILPQLVLLQRTQNIDNLTGNYVFMLGCAFSSTQVSMLRCVHEALFIYSCGGVP